MIIFIIIRPQKSQNGLSCTSAFNLVASPFQWSVELRPKASLERKMFWLIGLPRHWTSELCKTGICQKTKASETHSNSLMLFHFSLPAALFSTHSFQQCSSHPPHSPAAADPELTQSSVVHQDANQPSPRERSFLHLSPVSPRYITSCLWGMCVSLDIFWQISKKLSARLPAPSLAKIRVGLTPQGMLWTRKNVT